MTISGAVIRGLVLLLGARSTLVNVELIHLVSTSVLQVYVWYKNLDLNVGQCVSLVIRMIALMSILSR